MIGNILIYNIFNICCFLNFFILLHSYSPPLCIFFYFVYFFWSSFNLLLHIVCHHACDHVSVLGSKVLSHFHHMENQNVKKETNGHKGKHEGL